MNATRSELPLTATILATFLAAVASLALTLTVASTGLVASTAAALAPGSTAAVACVGVSLDCGKMAGRSYHRHHDRRRNLQWSAVNLDRGAFCFIPPPPPP